MTFPDVPLSYVNQLVAFIDVLGFKDIVSDENNLKIQAYFKAIADELKKLNSISTKIKFHSIAISDSVIIATPFDSSLSLLAEFIGVISDIQFNLAMESIWVRGGISAGKLYFDDEKNIVVGPALVRAVELEKRAIVPRILLDLVLVNDLNVTRNELFNQVNHYSRLGERKRSVLFDWVEHGAPPGFGNFDYAIFVDYFSALRTVDFKSQNQIYEAIKSNIYRNHDQYQKYRWLANYAEICTDDTGPTAQFFEKIWQL